MLFIWPCEPVRKAILRKFRKLMGIATGLSALAMTVFLFYRTKGRVKVNSVLPFWLVTEMFSPWESRSVLTI